ncbi:ras-related and estrogen-regulated growth inhibitor-like protein [Pollicipes pollicipes]|uniref:ras-related and estrogen-regulated growth inhibitor-like protein n=1 Tax=Pollicipes pollicipes TaxID=41117 RepID=UPI00188553BF|nr:ras-related and estrogen-regulated growth inhibitor-like protein [Pollicipes pollicipes]XP_037080764.1 ras-related and estrogen-regulated growth inhibitor-like protein [Pollicipes pollicipes]
MLITSRCSSQSSVSTLSCASSSTNTELSQNQGQLDKIKVLVLGAPGVGKTALCVRYLTKRYIGDYSSSGDMRYTHTVTFDGVKTGVDILDSCRCMATGCLFNHLRWGEAFLVVYSVCDRSSFQAARGFLETLGQEKLPGYFTTVLLGNKRDLEHARQVDTEDGHELSLAYGCPFYEVSAAESVTGVSLGFHTLLKEARSLQLLKMLPIRRKAGVNSVSKVLGNIFGKNGKYRKKRPSLSI